ncbi:MAG: hypothetical protein OEW23_19845 [Candidatus Aminicenantes bacterium]|nr:hypothetical protein [Candidatus Aminicenantes bacterium]
MSEKIDPGTILYCDYLHLDSANSPRPFTKVINGVRKKYKKWKVESKRRPVLILSECKEEKLRYRSYRILKLTTQQETAQKNGYVCVGRILGNKAISYVRSNPEAYPENLFSTNGKTDKIECPVTLDRIMKQVTLPTLGCPTERTIQKEQDAS